MSPKVRCKDMPKYAIFKGLNKIKHKLRLISRRAEVNKKTQNKIEYIF